MKTSDRVTDAETAGSRWNWLYKISGLAALIVGALFLIGMLSLIIAGLRPGAITGWLSLVQNNWLIVLFKLNAGFEGVQFNQLHGLNPLDIAILALVATMHLGLYVTLRRTSRVWSMIATVMLRSNIFGKAIAIVGILGSVLLLAGDFGTAAESHSNLVAALVGIGYVLLMTWCFLIGRRLFQLPVPDWGMTTTT